jgi:malonate decarboxylase alpha subunit
MLLCLRTVYLRWSRSLRAIRGTSPSCKILIGMMVIHGVYERRQVHSLNHGIGFDTAAIELRLPTYGESLGPRGKICEHWTLNPHPTMIPAIESGWI